MVWELQSERRWRTSAWRTSFSKIGMVSMSAGADYTDDGQEQVHLRRPSSPAATPDRPARPSRTRGLKGLNGGLLLVGAVLLN